ncbi:MAG TPA: glycosyltransferase [Stellaceae bacterium]|nr:glycosyltransferase [Stellaceae bacterium]
MNDAGAAPLHFIFLRHVPEVGVFACGACGAAERGWPPVTVATPAGEPAELFAGAARLSRDAAREVFAQSPVAARGAAFLRFFPEPAAAWNGGLQLTRHGPGGRAETHFAAATGHPAELGRILALAPADEMLRIAAAAVAAARRDGADDAGLPRPLERFLRLVHKALSTGGGQIDTVLRVPGRGMLIAGALEAEDEPPAAAALLALSGRRVALALPLPASGAGGAGRGFAVFGETGEPRSGERRWWLELTAAKGEKRRLPLLCPEAPPKPDAGIEAALALATQQAPDLGELFARAISPAVDRFWEETRRNRPPAGEILYGEPPAAPQVSLIVPLYGRIDFLHHQIARFSNDPEFRAPGSAIEIVYVLDDPPLEAPLRELARRVHEIYGLSFRVLSAGRHLGYSGANNLAAEAARGALLLLLNSDVLPRRPRWVGALAKAYRTLERCGVLGCRLLFEDGSIEHAGMTFKPSPEVRGAWTNEHPDKGLPPAFDPHREPARVAAVTGACLLIDRALYRRLGGLSEEYVLGDFEDSDLCLKAYAEGWATWYTPEVELYHLERQSIRQTGDADKRHRLVLYNMWKHARKWQALIPRALDGESPPSGGGRARTPRRSARRGRAGAEAVSAASAPSESASGRPR